MEKFALIYRIVLALLVVVPFAPAAVTIELKPVATGITNITSITAPRDGSGRLFITQQNGPIRIFDGTQLLVTNFLDIGYLTSYAAGTERAVLSLAFDPGYKTNGTFYVTYCATNSGALTLARFFVSANPNVAATNAQVLLSIPHPDTNHNGGQLQFGPDGYLYWSTGDGGGGCDGSNNGQTLTSRLGKMLRIDVNTNLSYRIPPSNPFLASNGVPPEIWAYGLRNPWKFSFDRSTGDLIIGDVGQNLQEEVDFQPANSTGGQNYGWRLYEGFLTNSCSVTFSNVPTVLPILTYPHSGGACSITGGYRYRGSQIPPLNGTYLYGDYCSKQVFGGTNVAGAWGASQVAVSVFNISAFGEDELGEIYLGGYSGAGGTLYQIVAHDTVGDGIADWWRQQYFGGGGTTTNGSSCANCDPDRDGQNNRQEYRAGTSPVNSQSGLQVANAVVNDNDFIVTFASVADRKYRVERTTNLVNAVWNTVADNIIGTGNPIAITDTGAAAQSKYFYRVRLLP